MIRTAYGTIIEVFEKVSQEAVAGAHHDSANLPEFQTMFSHFEPI